MKKGYMLACMEFMEDMLFLPELNIKIESIEMTEDGGVKINIYSEDLPDNSDIEKTYYRETKNLRRPDLTPSIKSTPNGKI